MRISILCLGIALAGCAAENPMLIVSRSDHQIANGTVDWFSQRAKITLNNRNYQGDYILAPAPQTTVIVNNNEGDKKDGKSSKTTVPRSTNGTGKLLLLSNDGDALRCEFSYEEVLGLKAIGTCTDSTQREYDLQIKSSY